MKLNAGLVLASSGLLAVAQPAAEVYQLPARDVPTAPSLPPALARLVVQHRLATRSPGPALPDLRTRAEVDDAVSALKRFGKATPPLFSTDAAPEPGQLVVMLDGMTEKQMGDLGRALGGRPAFTTSDPSAFSVENHFNKAVLQSLGATDGGHCDVRRIVNPVGECWDGKQSVFARYDTKKGSNVDEMTRSIAQLSELAKIGEMETTLILMSAAASRPASAEAQELRRRRADQVSLDKAVPPPSSAAEKPAPMAPPVLSSCYTSEEGCISATRNCSGHGLCQDKYAKPDGSNEQMCFACRCLSTRGDRNSITHWAGPTCAKQDVSVAFWLFVVSTLALVGIVWMAVSMLFNVGQEKLPGVIGAGVSRNK